MSSLVQREIIPECLHQYVAFRDEVRRGMEHPEWLGEFSREDLTELMMAHSKIWMYFDHSKPACSMMLIPATAKSIRKFNLGYKAEECVDYGPMMVAPAYRGNGFQLRMLEFLDDYAADHGYRYAIATVHPDNIYSVHNLEADGFQKTGEKEFTRGLRAIYVKDLTGGE